MAHKQRPTYTTAETQRDDSITERFKQDRARRLEREAQTAPMGTDQSRLCVGRPFGAYAGSGHGGAVRVHQAVWPWRLG